MSSTSLPIGTIIAFNGSPAEALAQQPNGWWVCDGTVVTDPLADPTYRGKPTPKIYDGPNNVSRCLLAYFAAGVTGGNKDITVPATGSTFPLSWDNNAIVNAAPQIVISQALTWVNGHPIEVSVNIPSYTLKDAAIPPYYTVIFLILVK